MADQNTQGRQLAPVDHLRKQVEQMKGEIEKALPKHVPSAKFVRSVQTSLQLNPDLGMCEPRTVLGACMKAASDGLIIDGREAALVSFNVKVKQPGGQETWEKHAQYMPMLAGILKKARQSGEISTISAHVVHQNDHFEYELGDEERIIHRPKLDGERGPIIMAYAIAKLRDGGIQRAVMTTGEIEAVRAVSKAAKSGPWVSWWSEMAKKTVIRRLCKMLPSSTDLDRVFENDDENYDLDYGNTIDAEPSPPPPVSTTGPRRRAGAAAQKMAAASQTPHDHETGEVLEGEVVQSEPPPMGEEPPPASPEDYGQQPGDIL